MAIARYLTTNYKQILNHLELVFLTGNEVNRVQLVTYMYNYIVYWTVIRIKIIKKIILDIICLLIK